MPDRSKPQPSLNGCCERCSHMTSTIEGLRSLLSRDGYPHLSKIELEKTSNLGCSFCTLLNSVLKPRSDSARHRRVHLRIDGSRDSVGTEPNLSDATAYPLHNFKVESINNSEKRNLDFISIWLDVFTAPGTYHFYHYYPR